MTNFTCANYDESKRIKEIIYVSTNVPLLYPLKTSENWRFSDVFRGYRIGILVETWVKLSNHSVINERTNNFVYEMRCALKEVEK